MLWRASEDEGTLVGHEHFSPSDAETAAQMPSFDGVSLGTLDFTAQQVSRQEMAATHSRSRSREDDVSCFFGVQKNSHESSGRARYQRRQL